MAHEQRKARYKLPAMPSAWQEFWLSIVFVLLVPLLPFGIDIHVLGYVQDSTLFLTAAIYVIGLGVTSHSKLMFGLAVVVGLTYMFLHGVTVADAATKAKTLDACLTSPQPVGGCAAFAATTPNHGWLDELMRYGAIVIFVLLHAGERYNRHVADGEPFWGTSGE